MAFYNEIFKQEKNGKLKHIASCTGSDTTNYFDNVSNLSEFNEQLKKLEKDNNFWYHSEKHPFPWDSYKVSDHLIVLAKNKRKWFEFWKPSHIVLISVKDGEDEHKCNFIINHKWYGDEDEDNVYNKEDLITLDLPKLKK